jgi:hypothetical protein
MTLIINSSNLYTFSFCSDLVNILKDEHKFYFI